MPCSVKSTEEEKPRAKEGVIDSSLCPDLPTLKLLGPVASALKVVDVIAAIAAQIARVVAQLERAGI